MNEMGSLFRLTRLKSPLQGVPPNVHLREQGARPRRGTFGGSPPRAISIAPEQLLSHHVISRSAATRNPPGPSMQELIVVDFSAFGLEMTWLSSYKSNNNSHLRGGE
jgi:hypothetical protein